MSSGEILDRCPRCGELAECDKYWRLRGDRYCFLFRCWCTGDWRGAAWRRIMTLEEARARTERLLEEEEREMARAREEGRRRLEMARELEGRLCARCVFWEGGLCRATPRGRHSPCFKPEEGRCLDFVEVVAVAVRHDPVVWAKVGRAGGELRIMSAVACGPYRPLDRPIALTGRGVRFAPEEALELARALETRQSRGPFVVERGNSAWGELWCLWRVDEPHAKFWFIPEDAPKIAETLRALARAHTCGEGARGRGQP